ncbi:uncharacterized protein LOC144638767 [Oculina patagonica]
MSQLMEQPSGAAVKVKRSQDDFYSKTVILLKKNDCQRSKDKVYIPNTIEMARIKKPNTGQYKTKVQFSKEMSEEMVKQKLQDTFSNFNLNGRFSCAAISQDRVTFQFYGTPRIWDGKTIKERLKGNSVLYIVMEDDQEIADPSMASILKFQVGAEKRTLTVTLLNSEWRSSTNFFYFLFSISTGKDF